MRENGLGLIRRGLAGAGLAREFWRANFKIWFLVFWAFKLLANFGARILGKRGIFGAWFNFVAWRENSRPEFKIKLKNFARF